MSNLGGTLGSCQWLWENQKAWRRNNLSYRSAAAGAVAVDAAAVAHGSVRRSARAGRLNKYEKRVMVMGTSVKRDHDFARTERTIDP